MLARVKAGGIVSCNRFEAYSASENLFLLIELFHHFFIAMDRPTQIDSLLLLISFLYWNCLWPIRSSFSLRLKRGRLVFFAARRFWQFCTRIGFIFILLRVWRFLFFFCRCLLIFDSSTRILRREPPSSRHSSTSRCWDRLWLGCLRMILHHLRAAPFGSWLASLAIVFWCAASPFLALGLAWCCLGTSLHFNKFKFN